MYLIFDTETTGLPQNYNAPVTDLDNWPRLVQIAWQLHDQKGKLLNAGNRIIRPDGFTIPFNAEKIHGISTEIAKREGLELIEVLEEFAADVEKADWIVGHNIEFDINIMGAEFIRGKVDCSLLKKESYCTKIHSTDFVRIPGGKGGKYKWPTLTELHVKLFGTKFDDAHDAAYDVDVTAKCFFGLIKEKVTKPLGKVKLEDILYEPPQLKASNFAKKDKKKKRNVGAGKVSEKLSNVPFSHLHVHSQFSVLQATSNIPSIIAKAKAYNMPAVALTDNGNMMGTFHFVKAALKEGIKPIVGCEFYVAEERKKLKFTKDNPDKRFNQVLLAKNKEAYQNLAKLSSIGYVEGLYGLYPRIDKELIQQHSEGLIALTGGLDSEVPFLILNIGEDQAEEAFKWWLDVFGEDFYIELNRHGLEEEEKVNEVLLRFSEKYNVKVIAANNTFYLDKSDANAHDALLCIKDGELQSTPVGKGRGKRYGFPNNEYYFKSPDEMKALFNDLPQAIINTNEIIEKVEEFKLERDVLLPEFKIPEEFKSEDDYLRHLTYEGAKERYKEVTPAIEERLDYELSIIKNTGYPGYFLIVQDFTRKAREMGVSVGPGRGSAAGSAVAYCIGITNVDPIKYDLLFERFLNPDRVSLPDIDIDFDDEGRGKVIDYVINKYGKNQVAQIITYGTMAAKSSIRDAARVMELTLAEANILSKLVPEKPGTTLDKAFEEVKELREIKDGTNLQAKVLEQAKILEGSVRNTGTHACGIIITPDDITNYIPVSITKDADLLVTQFDNSIVESAGMLKMDFLGLKTLTIIKHAIRLIEQRQGVKINADEIPLDDKKTYELYQRGETNGTFQFESPGMQKHLRHLKPDRFEDLIAMNALYRPGPLEYIPNFIKRKHGLEPIEYDIPEMEEYLKDTYGITVYQEQVMLLSQKLAGFTKGQADSLRKAMGKKIQAMMDDLKPKFINGCKANGYDEKVVEKVWVDWEAFAKYAFNKSHSTCYSVVAFQTAYLKAHYPAEYMAAVLTNNMNDIKKVTFFMEECKRLGIPVLGPDVNESESAFTVNDSGEIRFGLAAIKGAGEAAVESIIEERKENGPYRDFFDFATRVNLRTVNKKTFESLSMAGSFDCFEKYHRKQYLFANDGDMSLIEKAIKYANKLQESNDSPQASLFGDAVQVEVPAPEIAYCEPYSEIEKLNIEKEVVGFYISGHPLDQFKVDLKTFCTCTTAEVERYKNREIKIGGIITSCTERESRRGKPFGLFSVEDYEGSLDVAMFGEDYLKYKHLIEEGRMVLIKGKVQERYNQEGVWEFRPQVIELLSDIRERLSKGIQIDMELDKISEEIIKSIKEACMKHPGNCTLRLNVIDPLERMKVEMSSGKFKIAPTNEFMDVLSELEDVSYKILA